MAFNFVKYIYYFILREVKETKIQLEMRDIGVGVSTIFNVEAS